MNATEKDNVFYCGCGFSWRRGMSGSHRCEDGLRVKLAELMAENAALKNPDNWLSQSDYGYEAAEAATQNGATEDESLRAGMIAIINRIKTQATDAFLAEVRAQGVEMFALQQSQIAAEQEQAGDYEFSRHCSISAAEACEFAEELREGKCCEVQS